VRQRVQLPASVFIGLVASAFGATVSSFADVVARHADDSFSIAIRWEMFDFGCMFAGLVLVAAGLFAVSGRTHGAARLATRIAAWMFVAALLWQIARPVCQAVFTSDSAARTIEYIWRAFGALTPLAVIALSIAARAWTRPRSPWVPACAVLGILAAVFGSWLPYFGSWLFEHLYEGHPRLLSAYWLLRELAIDGSILVLVHGILHDSAPAVADPSLAKVGFQRAAQAMLGRVFAALVLAVFGLGMFKAAGTIKLALIAAPTLTILTAVGFAFAMLAVDRAELPGMPRIRLVLGAATWVWSAAIQLFYMFSLVDGQSYRPEAFTAWTTLAPLIATGGIILVLSALHGFAQTREGSLRTAVVTRTTLFVIMSLMSGLLPLAISHAQVASTMVVVALMAAVCGIVALVALAGLLSITGDSLTAAPQIPQARIHTRAP